MNLAGCNAAEQQSSPWPPQAVVPAGASSEQIDALFTALYADLRRLARREVRRNGAADILGTGTLIHEAWLDIRRTPSLSFGAPGQFLAYAARMMRGLVIDRVRRRAAQKHGGGLIITSLDTHAEQVAEPRFLESIGEALEELETIDPQLAQVVDLKFFAGFTLAEVAHLQGVSERTTQRQWEKARALLYRAMRAE